MALSGVELTLIVVSLLAQAIVLVSQAAIGVKRVPESALVMVVTSTVSAIVFGGIAVATGSLELSALVVLPWKTVAQIASAAVLYSYANVTLFVAAAAIGPTRFGIVFTMRVVPIALLSAAFLEEPFTWLKLLGIVQILGGIVLAIWMKAKAEAKVKTATKTPEPEEENNKVTMPEWVGWFLAITGTIAFGVANTFDALVVKRVETMTYLPVRLLLPVLLIGMTLTVWLVIPKPAEKRAAVRLRLRERWLPLMGAVIFIPLAAATFMLAVELSEGKVALLASIHQLSLFPTILLGAWLMGAASGRVRDYLASATLCCGGVALALGAPIPFPG